MSRKRPSENLDSILLDEVGGLCPLCGAKLLEKKNKNILKEYEIAHIYPSSPTSEQLETLKSVPKAENIESEENLIPLCFICHKKQDVYTTEQEYMRLYKIKQNIVNKAKTKIDLSKIQIEDEIKIILQKLKISEEKNRKNLSYEPIAVDKKIAKENILLLENIKDKVVKYFPFIQETFKNIETTGQNKFDIIASQVKTSFLKTNMQNFSQEDIFNSLVEWLDSKTQNHSRIACEYIIAFFVQNCEVFSEITQ